LRWRKGSRPTIEHLLRISQTFGVNLESLLVLSGHAPTGSLGDVQPPPPPQSVTPTERIILNADLDEHLESIMQDYWKNRIEEERGRVRKLVKLLTEDSVPLSDERFSAELGEILGSRLPAHVSRVVVDWAQYRTPPPPKGEGRSNIGKSLQAILQSIDEMSVVRGKNGLYYLELMTKNGLERMDKMPFDDERDAEKALVAFLSILRKDH
jgi:hypothetical protein